MFIVLVDLYLRAAREKHQRLHFFGFLNYGCESASGGWKLNEGFKFDFLEPMIAKNSFTGASSIRRLRVLAIFNWIKS